MSTNEIITLQFGNYSNFVGTHYWNSHQKRLLERENSTEDNRNYITKLFRESQSSRTRFVPRAICFDLKTKLQTLKQDGTFADEDDISDGFTTGAQDVGDIVTYSEPKIEQNDFVKQVQSGEFDQNGKVKFEFESEVKTWSDYMTYELDNHSIKLLSENYNDGDDFKFFGKGQDEYKNIEDDFEDYLHYWAEECDYLEGFQLMSDLHNGYTGLQSKVLEYLADDYNKKSRLSFMNWSTSTTSKDEKEDFDVIYQYLNVALSLQTMKNYNSLSVFQGMQSDYFKSCDGGIQIPYVEYQNDLAYHTSAILAATLDSTTIPLYQTQGTMNMSELCHHVSHGKWKLAGTSFGLPLQGSLSDGNTLFDTMLSAKGFYNGISTCLFPNLKNVVLKPNSQLVVLQNLSSDLVCPDQIDSKILQGLGLNRNVFNRHPMSVLEYFSERFYPCKTTLTKLYYSTDKLRQDQPFPDLIKGENNPTTFSSLYTSPCFYDFLHEIVMALRRMNLHKVHAIQEFGLDRDMITELTEDLVQIAQTYNYEKAFNELEE